MFWHVSICLSTPRGGTLARSRWGGGYPCQVQVGGTPRVPPIRPGWGVPHLRHPPSDLAGGTLTGGYPTSGTPPSDLAGGVPQWGVTPPQVPPSRTWLGVSHLGYPPLDLARGYPDGGTPPRVPPSDLAKVSQWGYPTSDTPCQTWPGGTLMGYPLQVPPHQTWWGGYPDGGYPISRVLDTPRSVCLFRSRRRTFFLPTTFEVREIQVKEEQTDNLKRVFK